MASFFKWLASVFKQPPAFLADIDSRNRAIFNYVSQDKETSDDYRVHKTAFLNRGPYSGDCDDFAATVAYFVLQAKNPNVRKVTWRLCKTSTGVVHVVVGVEMLNGDVWVSDNRARGLMLFSQITDYEWLYYKNAEKVLADIKVI